METYLECLPCFVRQALEAVALTTDIPAIQEQVLKQVFSELGRIDLGGTPPVMGQKIHKIVRDAAGVKDAYIKVKEQCNTLGRKMYPELKKRIIESESPFETAVRLAIAGNIIDFGVKSHSEVIDIEGAIERAIVADLGDVVAEFETAVGAANKILYIADNAGETFFDKLLLERMPCEKVTYAVRGGPIINDALIADAEEAGITELVRVIDNGSDAPGTVLEQCSKEFRGAFDAADLVISKGQGNYETLSSIDKDIFFLLKAKCPVIARHIGCAAGTTLLFRKRPITVTKD
ncbi:MAG: ARMT1-like domain-containing protein [Phycisphaerae bacterium]|jgi:hypothetical protein